MAYLFSVEESDEFLRPITVTDTVKIEIREPDFLFARPYFAKGFTDYFILSTETGTYKIYADGTHRRVIAWVTNNVFRHDGKLYALASEETAFTTRIFISTDEGENWTPYSFPAYPAELRTASYYTLGDSLIATLGANLFALNFQDLDFTIRTLENEGLDGSSVTSASVFNDSIFLATYSGVYARQREAFFEDKE